MGVSNFGPLICGKLHVEEVAKEAGAGGLAYIQVRGAAHDTWRSPIVKFFSEEELAAIEKELGIEEGDLILFGCD